MARTVGKAKRGWGSRAAHTGMAQNSRQQQGGRKRGAGRRAIPLPAPHITLAERFALLEHQRRQLPRKAASLGVAGSKAEKKRRPLRNQKKWGGGKGRQRIDAQLSNASVSPGQQKRKKPRQNLSKRGMHQAMQT